MKTNLNDFAFNSDATRLQQTSEKGIEATNPPLTKREYFAAMALQGLISEQYFVRPECAANYATEMADALIKALNEQ